MGTTITTKSGILARIRWGLLLGLLPLIVACKSVTLPANGPQTLAAYTPRGQIGLFDAAQRRAELSRATDTAKAFCPHGAPRVIKPIQREVVGHGALYGIYNHPNPFAAVWLHIDESLAGWLMTGDRAYLDTLREWLLQSAEADAFSRIVPDPDKYQYLDPLFNLRFGLKPVIVAYDVLRQEKALSPAQEHQLVAWIEKTVASTDRGYCGELENWCDRPNHTTLHAGTTFMLWGGVSGNPQWFGKGIDYFIDALGNSRADGSNQFDVSAFKGNRSLRKQNQITGYLVMIAEIAAQHGYDLYSVKVGEVSVWTTLDFLVKAIADDKVISRHTGQELHSQYFLYQDRHSDETVAWFELLRRRFPEHSLVRQFEQIKKVRRPWSSPAYGGNLTCFTGQLIRN